MELEHELFRFKKRKNSQFIKHLRTNTLQQQHLTTATSTLATTHFKFTILF